MYEVQVYIQHINRYMVYLFIVLKVHWGGWKRENGFKSLLGVKWKEGW
jgi:hypothetical protein